MENILEESETDKSLKAKKFIIWLFVISSSIMFGGWTSYYVVFSASRGKGHGLVLPDLFMFSTGILLLSSLFLFLASRAYKNGAISRQRTFLWTTMVLGCVFGILQFQGWLSLIETGAVLVNNNASISMIYIISGFHLLHILAGLGILSGVLIGSYKNISAVRMGFRMQIGSIFWHFIDILWIYLYVFLLLNS